MIERRLLLLACAAWACMGMICTGPDGPSPALPETRPDDIRLALLDPADGSAAAIVRWSWPKGERADYFEIFQSYDRDTLGDPVATRSGTDSLRVAVPIPDDSARPFTLYYGVRAVVREPTGQRLYGKAIPVDSLHVQPGVSITAPAPGRVLRERALDVEVETASDVGVVMRQSLFEKSRSGWRPLLDTCLPMSDCSRIQFGHAVQADALVSPSVPAGDTVETLYCVLGDEGFEGRATGRAQSLGCTRFWRTGP